MNSFQKRKSISLQFSFGSGKHVHSYWDLHDDVNQVKLAARPSEKAADSKITDVPPFLIQAKSPKNSMVKLLMWHWHGYLGDVQPNYVYF